MALMHTFRFMRARNDCAKKCNGEGPRTWQTSRTELLSLLPCAFGLGLARTGYALLSPTDYALSNSLTSNSFATARSILLVALIVLLCAHGKTLSKRFVNTFAHLSIAISTACLIGLCICSGAPDLNLSSILPVEALYIVGASFGLLSFFYWFRRMRNNSPAAIVVTIAVARILYEAAMFAQSPLTPTFSYALGAIVTLLQCACIQAARRAYKAFPTNDKKPDRTFLGFDSHINDAKFLVLCVLACVLLSSAHHLLRTWPVDAVTPLTETTTLGACLLTVLLLAGGAVAALRFQPLTLLLVNWLTVSALASIGLLLYTAAPQDASWGAMFVTASNSLKNVLKWYLIVSFISIGKRDPYLYAAVIWLIFLEPRVLGDGIVSLLGAFGPVSSNETEAVISFMLNASSLLLLLGIGILFADEKRRAESTRIAPTSLFGKIAGIEEPSSMAEVREQAMTHSIERLGKQFLLSEREMEVIKLYALGHTQSSIAEMLCISKTTVHAHIRHTYEKTNLHSRQGILDYLNDYDE